MQIVLHIIASFFLMGNILAKSHSILHKIPLTEDYRKAKETARVYMRPIALLFLGSDWNDYSKKFIEEIIQDSSFHDCLKSSVIFVKVDFPELNNQPAQELSQNYTLKEQHQIKHFPTVVLLDPKQREITRLGYMSGGGKKYALHIKKLLAEYERLWNQLEEKSLSSLSEDDLVHIYQIADELRCDHYREQILEYGCQHANTVYFLVEKYNQLAARGEIQSPSAKKLRHEIMVKDPENEQGALLRLAILDFQQNALGVDPLKAIEPLLSFIEMYGKKNNKSLWQIYLMISQFLFDKEQFDKALDFAKLALDASDGKHQSEVTKVIHFMEGAIHNS